MNPLLHLDSFREQCVIKLTIHVNQKTELGIPAAFIRQDGWILVKFFFGLFMDRDGVEVHKLAKNEQIYDMAFGETCLAGHNTGFG